MEIFNNLAEIGLTPKILQIIILIAVIVYFVGTLWRVIATGCAILFCIAVFAMPNNKSDKTEVKQNQQLQDAAEVKQIEPAPPVAEVKPETKEQADERMFLEDCNLHSGYTPSQCKALWESDKDEIQKSNWKYKYNKKYIQKVKHGT
jgi:hypothetical protein